MVSYLGTYRSCSGLSYFCCRLAQARHRPNPVLCGCVVVVTTRPLSLLHIVHRKTPVAYGISILHHYTFQALTTLQRVSYRLFYSFFFLFFLLLMLVAIHCCVLINIPSNPSLPR
jgi:hypothetical protein